MPDYRMTVEADNVVFRPKSHEVVVPLPLNALRLRHADTHDMARRLASGWDVYVLACFRFS